MHDTEDRVQCHANSVSFMIMFDLVLAIRANPFSLMTMLALAIAIALLIVECERILRHD